MSLSKGQCNSFALVLELDFRKVFPILCFVHTRIILAYLIHLCNFVHILYTFTQTSENTVGHSNEHTCLAWLASLDTAPGEQLGVCCLAQEKSSHVMSNLGIEPATF